MGAEGSKEKAKKGVPNGEVSSRSLDSRVVRAFESLSQGRLTLSIRDFTQKFGEDFGSDLWKYLSDGGTEKYEMDLEQFGKHASSLLASSTDRYVKVLAPADHLIHICAESAGVDPYGEGQQFLDVLTKEMEKAEKADDLDGWKRVNCPKLCDAVQSRVLGAFQLDSAPSHKQYISDVMTPFEMWFMCCSLPPSYFPTKLKEGAIEEEQWTRLFSSSEHGISVTRFETNVFDYRGPTVTIIRLQDGSLVVLATDQEWRNSGTSFTSAKTVFLKMLPEFIRVENASIYCNFKIRNFPLKLSVDRYLSVDKDMSDVVALEVFGCSGGQVLQEQQKMKERQKRQVEKNQKVPLPGNWDDNPDKFLLELGGVYSTADRREIFRRDDEEKKN